MKKILINLMILQCLKKNNIEILDIATEDGDLEDVFVQLTNN